MTMASNSLLCPNYLIPISTSTPTARHTFPSRPYLPSASYYIQSTNCKREFPLPRVASIPYQPNNVDYLEEEFSGHGVTFEGIGDSCVAKVELENGSVATLLLPSGLITSYKAPMWHGGKVELLHTSVSEGQDGDAVIKGGVSLAFNFQGDSDEVSWSPSKWALHDIRGTAEESIQVELINRESEGMIELKYIVTLEEDVLSSELVISNSKFSSLQLTGSILSHLTVSTPDATYALGLERSNIFTRPPILSEFAISPPDSEQEDGFNKLLSQVTVKRLFPGWGARNQNNRNEAQGSHTESEEDTDCEEIDNYKHLREKISQIYTCAPRNFTIIDRGRRNSVQVRRDGFDELYLFSPGSSLESYGKYDYICVGQAAMLKPITIDPEEVWRGGQHLHNPNL